MNSIHVRMYLEGMSGCSPPLPLKKNKNGIQFLVFVKRPEFERRLNGY